MNYKGILGAVVLIFVGIIFGAILVSGFGVVSSKFSRYKSGSFQTAGESRCGCNKLQQIIHRGGRKVTPQLFRFQ